MKRNSIKRLENLEHPVERRQPPNDYHGMHEIHWWAKYGEDHNPALHELALQELAAVPIWAAMEFLNCDVSLLARVRFEVHWTAEIEDQWSEEDPEYAQAIAEKRETLTLLAKTRLIFEAEKLRAERVARKAHDRLAIPSRSEIED